MSDRVVIEYSGEQVSAPKEVANFLEQARKREQAQDTLRWAVSEGIITGTSATTLTPQGHATRAEAAAMLQRYLEK